MSYTNDLSSSCGFSEVEIYELQVLLLQSLITWFTVTLISIISLIKSGYFI